MKKYISLSFFVLCTMLFAACSASALKPDSDTVYVIIKQNASSDVYGIHYEYYIGGTPIGGAAMSSADNSAIPKGEKLLGSFTEREFPDGTDTALSEFAMELYVMDEDGRETPVKNKLSFAVEYGKKYTVEISGSQEDGYKAKYID